MRVWNPFEYFKNAAAKDYESFLRGAEAYQEWLSTQPDQKQVGIDECMARNANIQVGLTDSRIQSGKGDSGVGQKAT